MVLISFVRRHSLTDFEPRISSPCSLVLAKLSQSGPVLAAHNADDHTCNGSITTSNSSHYGTLFRYRFIFDLRTSPLARAASDFVLTTGFAFPAIHKMQAMSAQSQTLSKPSERQADGIHRKRRIDNLARCLAFASSDNIVRPSRAATDDFLHETSDSMDLPEPHMDCHDQQHRCTSNTTSFPEIAFFLLFSSLFPCLSNFFT